MYFSQKLKTFPAVTVLMTYHQRLYADTDNTRVHVTNVTSSILYPPYIKPKSKITL